MQDLLYTHVEEGIDQQELSHTALQFGTFLHFILGFTGIKECGRRRLLDKQGDQFCGLDADRVGCLLARSVEEPQDPGFLPHRIATSQLNLHDFIPKLTHPSNKSASGHNNSTANAKP